jgi:hypothetical protein
VFDFDTDFNTIEGSHSEPGRSSLSNQLDQDILFCTQPHISVL